jgi:GNAT superfamily N-acetyltransferase
VWELEGYGWRWGAPAAGILDIQVRPDLRRQGLAKLLIAQILRFVQDQFFGIAEVHAPADRPDAIALCQSVGLEQVDVGTTYLKQKA